jgi:alanine dehydrogenase
MPGACATTSTRALTNATSDYALQIANKGWKKALSESEGLKKGLNICYGEVTNKHVAEDLGYNYADADKFL